MRNLTAMFEPVVESMGYELVGVEYHSGGGHGTLRVYVDHADGIGLDDCAAISHQLSGLLDVEEPIREAYDLEISSPGIDRPLFKRADFERFAGRRARIRLAAARDGRRNFAGELQASPDAALVRIRVDGEDYDLPFADIAKANLVGEI